MSISPTVAFAQSADLSIGTLSLGAIVANANGSWTVPVTYTVTNIGTSATNAGWYDLAYLSTDGSLDTGDTYAGYLGYRSATLAAGASYTVTTNLTTATTITPGTYTVIVKADGRSPAFNGGSNLDNGALAETNESNNVASASITLTRPDLSIGTPTLGTIVANANGSWTVPVTYTVTNQGTIGASAGWYDLAYLSTDGTLDTSDTYAGNLGYRGVALAAGASYTVTTNLTTATTITPGTYTLIVKADGRSPAFNGGTNVDNGALAETNETNNVASASITLTRPDLSMGTPTLGTIVANANGSWTVPVTYTVTNVGSVAASPGWYDSAYLSSDAVLDNSDFPASLGYRSTALAAGSSYTVTANVTTATTLPSGTYTLFTKADGRSPSYGGANTDNGTVTETNESNNLRSVSITLANKAITATTLSSSVNPVNLRAPTVLTATVAGNGTPTGSVTFKDGTAALATVELSGGVATYTATFTSSGTHSLTAAYSGAAGNPASTSAVVSESVSTVTATSTALSATPNPVVAGEIATLTATIIGNNASGSVTFRDGSTLLGSAPVSGNVAIYAATFASAGSRSLSATYAGDALNTTSTSPALAFTVNATAPGQLPAAPVSPAPVLDYEYDAQGNPTKATQAKGQAGFNFESKASYDSLSRVKDSTDPKNGVTRYEYNGREDLTQVTDPRNLVTQYPRNGLGDATSLVSPDTGTATHTFDEAGNLKTRTDSRGVLTTHSYDALNRLTQSVYSKAGLTTQTFDWTYDQTGTGYAYGIGRLTSTSHPSGSTQYTYDPQGRLLTDIQRVDAATGGNTAQITETVSYAYDAAGNITSITYPSGRQVIYTYTDGQLSGIGLAPAANGTPVSLISQVQWEPFGGVKSWNWQMDSGVLANAKVYDTSGRLVRYSMYNIVRDLSYDAADRITAYTHYDITSAAPQPSLDQSFGYDQNGRLTTVSSATASWAIGYDANGNRTSATLNGVASSYTTEATSNRLSSITNPARSFGYDAAGNTTNDTAGYTSTYDAAGRLSTLTKVGVTTTYSYNGLGQRVRKFSSSGATSTTLFVYDQSGQLLGEYDQAGNAIREYVWLGSTPVAMFMPNGSNPPSVYYVYTDHLGAPRVVTSRSGSLRWRWLAEPFGTTAPETNPAGLGGFTQNLRFPGQYADQESGLFYNYFRNYDSTTGRYSQSDPIGLDGGINTYAYVGGNPLQYVDPLGHNRKGGKSGQWWEFTDRNFQRWFHQCVKQPGDRDATRDELADAYATWVEWGKPDGMNGCGGPPPAPAPAPAPAPESPACGESCKRVLKSVRDAVTGTLILIFVFVCATS
ncbi:MAG: Ig-like domain repeat protein [Planctomycetes bacterium]|nr:Ig-like domain repeat protein [Planctomycetota bacterium]